MHVLVIPFGSHGDVHPMLGLARALRDRGHRVTVIAIEYFGELVRRLGFEHVPYGEPGEYERVIEDPRLWHPTASLQVVFEGLEKGLRPIYEAIASRYVQGETVVIAGSLAMGARIAQDKLGVPTATVHLQPSVLRTEHDFPHLPGVAWARRLPRIGKRWLFRAIDRLVIDRMLSPAVNALRAELGLAPVSYIMGRWWNSPQLVLGLFPSWYAAPQPDWPPQVVLTGFPLFDESHDTPLPPEVAAFLDAGEPPIVFTPGSAMKHAHRFFAEAADACAKLGRRAAFLTRFPDQLPERLPETIRHFSYVPFSQIVPRAAALVHHGGVGTSAQGMAAGVPQLVMPLAHDQFDNASRMERLGVARSLIPKRFLAADVARLLAELIDSPRVADDCRRVASLVRQDDPIGSACRAIEERLGTSASAPMA